MNTRQLITAIAIAKWRLRSIIRRFRLAVAYALNRLGTDQANEIIYECQAAAGWYPLEGLSVDNCLETALDCYWQDHPELESIVQSACAYVASKWEANGHSAAPAQDRALDLVVEFAQSRGISLIRHQAPE
jgi:hypothetical protein